MWKTVLRWLLPLSLAVNLFFLVMAVRHHLSMHPHMADPANVVMGMRSRLPEADAQIMKQAFAAREEMLDEAHRASTEIPDRIRAALTAEPFDPEALKAALAASEEAHLRMQHAMTDAFIDAVGKMSPEGRAQLAASHDFFGPHMEHPGHGHHHPMPPPPDGPPPPR